MSYNRKELKMTERKQDKRDPFKNDMIVDPQGQWAHPGENTRIPGNNITMQGVPYPVYAVPNAGYPVMMMPGGQYNFPGADYVDEYPMAKSGIHIKPENKGKFTAKANAAGMGVQEFASKVLSAPEGRYSPATRKQANFARNASKWKKQDGGFVEVEEGRYAPERFVNRKGELKKGVKWVDNPNLDKEYFTNTEGEEVYAYNANALGLDLEAADPWAPYVQRNEGPMQYQRKPMWALQDFFRRGNGVTFQDGGFTHPMQHIIETSVNGTGDMPAALANISSAQDRSQYAAPPEGQSFYLDYARASILDPAVYGYSPTQVPYQFPQFVDQQRAKDIYNKPAALQDGGEYIDMELTDEEIANLRAQGYEVEEL